MGGTRVTVSLLVKETEQGYLGKSLGFYFVVMTSYCSNLFSYLKYSVLNES